MRHSRASAAAKIKKTAKERSGNLSVAGDLQIVSKYRDTNPSPILIVSKDGKLLFANEASAPILHSWKCKVGDILPDHWQTIISETMTSGSNRQELITYAEYTFSLIITPLGDAGCVNIYGQDITRHSQSEKILARSAKISERLRTFMVTLNSINNIDEMMNQILDAAVEITEMDGGGVYLIKDQNAILHLHRGLPRDFVKAVSSMPMSAQPANIAIKSDRPVNICDISDDISALIHEHGIKYAYSAPLRIGNNVIGFINLASYREKPPDEIGLHSFWMLALESGSFLKRAQAEKELRKSGKRYRQLIENANEAIFVTQDGKIVFSNPKLNEISGFTSQNLIHLPLNKLIHYDDIPLIFSINDKILKQESHPSTFEVRLTDRDGIIKWIEIRAIKIIWDDKPAILNFAGEITERKNAEEALMASEERFRLAAQSVSDLIYEWDILSTSFVWHGDIDTMLGYDKGEFPRTLEGWAKNVHPDDYDRVIAAIEQSLRLKKAFSENYRMRCKDGSYRHWIDKGMAPSTYSANPFRWVRVVSDITERRKAEESVRQISSRNEALLESVPDIIMEVDREKVYTWANKAGYDFFGADVIGKVASDYFEGEQRTLEMISPLFEGPNDIICLESWQRRQDGEKRLLSWMCKALRDSNGNVFGALSSARDITERIKAEESLRQSEDKFRTVFENAPIGKSLSAIDGRLIKINNALCQMLGYSEQELTLQNWGTITHPDDIELTERQIKLLLSNEQKVCQFDKRYIHKNGNIVYTSASTFLLRDEAGCPLYFITHLIDITERKKMEEALRESRGVLHAVLNSIPVRVFWKDKNLQYLGCNTAFAQDSGFEKPEDIIGKDDYALGWSEQAELYRADDRSVIENGNPKLQFEEPLTMPSGEQIHLLTSKVPLRDANGDVVGVLGTYQDITGLKRLERALEDEAIRKRILIEQSSDGIVILDHKGKVFEANLRYAEMLGYSLEEVGNLHVWDWDTQWTPEQLLEMINKVDDAGDHFETKHRRKDGSQIDVEISSNGAICGNRKLIFCVCRDISERKKAEEALKQKNEYLNILKETSIDLISQLELDRLLGIILNRAAQIMGTTAGYIDLLEPGAETLTPAVGLGVLTESLKFAVRPGEGLTGMVWQSGEPMIIDDYDAWSSRIEDHKKGLIKSIIGVPLLSKAKVIGVLGLAYERGVNRTFDQESLELLTQFARFATIAIENARLYKTAQKEIGERKKSEQALRASESKIRRLHESMRDAFVYVDLQGRIMEFNETYQKMLGFEPDELRQKTYVDVTPDKWHAIEAEIVEKQLNENGFTDVYEKEYRRKDGTTFPIEIRTHLTRDEDGQPCGYWAIVRDITERKRAEDALRDSEAKYRTVIENMQDVFYRIDLNGNLVMLSPSGAKHLGYESAEVLIGANVSKQLYANPEDRTQFLAELQAKGSVRDYELRLKRVDGSVFFCSASSHFYYDSNGKVIGIEGILRDINERKQAETDLKASEERYKLVVENANDAIFVAQDMKIRFSNSRLPEILKYPTESVIERSFADFIHPDDRDLVVKRHNARLAGEDVVSNYALRVIASDGGIRWLEINIVKIVWNGKLATLNFGKDITERKQAEEALQRLATAVEQTADSIIITDYQGDIQYANPAFYKVTGYQIDEVLGKNPRILKSDKQDSAFYKKMWETILQGNTWTGRLINKKKDGSLYTEEVSISPIFDKIDQITNYVAVKKDITQVAALENQLLHSQKMEAVGRLAGGVAHDFNNLLTAILGYSDILHHNLKGQDRMQADVSEIKKASERAASLTRQLLAFSRKQVIQPKVLNLNNIVTDMNKMLKRLIGEHIDLVLDTADDLWQIKADPGQIEQIVMNLAVNARDAMPDGGKLVIKTSNSFYAGPKENSNSNNSSGEFIMLTINDNGSGISEDIKPHIFDPFFTTKEQGKGTGLGLATVYGIVQQNGGHVEVESHLGYGTTFMIYLPRFTEIPLTTDKVNFQMESVGGNETILVVEDEVIVRELTRRLLSGLGYRTLVATEPMEAIEICKKFKDNINLMLSDIVMPKMNGEILAKEIRKLIPGMPILFMSGYTDDALIKHEALEFQGDFIQKPFSKEALAEKIRDILNRKSLQNAGETATIV